MKLQHVKSSFPLAVGAEISAVDNDCFSSTGKPFSFIALANAESSTEKTLQEDDISLAYEFAQKFPGYTADNLSEKGIHEVGVRRFVLVSADHPIVSAISECAPLVPQTWLFRAMLLLTPTLPSQLGMPTSFRQSSLRFPRILRNSLTPHSPWQTDGRDLGALARLAPPCPATPPRPPPLTHPPPRPQMMPEGLVK